MALVSESSGCLMISEVEEDLTHEHDEVEEDQSNIAVVEGGGCCLTVVVGWLWKLEEG